MHVIAYRANFKTPKQRFDFVFRFTGKRNNNPTKHYFVRFI